MKHSESMNELASALVKAQSTMQKALTDRENPFFKSKYADLASVWGACKDSLSENGLAVMQTLDECDDGVIIETMLVHASGQYNSGRLKLKPQKNDPQGIGSCITYGRRYSLAAMIGIIQEDDDAESATKRESKEEPKPDSSPAPSKKQTKKHEPYTGDITLTDDLLTTNLGFGKHKDETWGILMANYIDGDADSIDYLEWLGKQESKNSAIARAVIAEASKRMDESDAQNSPATDDIPF